MEAGGAVNRLPHANQLWMLVGFALFSWLSGLAECLEVFPQATVRVLGSGEVHKSRAGAVEAQFQAVARHTGWPGVHREDPSPRSICRSPRHDALDAYLSAWVAALDEKDRVAYGEPPEDAIWVPRLAT